MSTNILQRLLKILKENSNREKFYTENPIEAFRDDFLKHRKELLALTLKEENPLPLCLRFCWAQSFLKNITSDEFIKNRIELLRLFGLADIGVPFEETPALNQAILTVLEEYSKSEIEEPSKLGSYENFVNVSRDTRTKYEKDPRFEDYFEAAKWGVFR